MSPVVVLGPTASGKSDVAMALAERAAGGAFEIVAVDAMQVYRHMDIGTAKPSAQDQDRVPHHGIDLVEPDADHAVAEFAAAATEAIDSIARRHGRPLLVAGTGLYLRAITDPMEIPGCWPDVRDALELRLQHQSSADLYAELVVADPAAAAKMEPSNARRVVRALEVCIGSGRPFSSFGPGLDSYSPNGFTQFGLRWPRPLLAGRVERRVHLMMEAGLLAEVRGLRERFPNISRTARQALGYKELFEHLDGRSSLEAAVEQVIVRTRQFAVRQERWFRRDPRIQWIDVEADSVSEAVPVIEEVLSR